MHRAPEVHDGEHRRGGGRGDEERAALGQRAAVGQHVGDHECDDHGRGVVLGGGGQPDGGSRPQIAAGGRGAGDHHRAEHGQGGRHAGQRVGRDEGPVAQVDRAEGDQHRRPRSRVPPAGHDPGDRGGDGSGHELGQDARRPPHRPEQRRVLDPTRPEHLGVEDRTVVVGVVPPDQRRRHQDGRLGDEDERRVVVEPGVDRQVVGHPLPDRDVGRLVPVVLPGEVRVGGDAAQHTAEGEHDEHGADGESSVAVLCRRALAGFRAGRRAHILFVNRHVDPQLPRPECRQQRVLGSGRGGGAGARGGGSTTGSS